MPVTVEQLLTRPEFQLRLLTAVESPALRSPLAWAHSSDLADPTPWLAPAGLLLTDGSQFPLVADGPGRHPDFAAEYVARLVDREVAALGFATEVVHQAVPAGLLDACRGAGLTLVEVGGRTPFMAIIAFVSDAAAREHRDRLEWSLAAHRSLARAALRADGLDAVLRELERQLGCWVALFDAAGYRVPTRTERPIPAAVAREVGDAAHTTLSRGTRGSLRISTAHADVTVQTLGRSGELQGVLAVGTQAPLGGAERELVTSVIALASIALDQTRAIEDARRRLRTVLFELLLSGASDEADSTAQRWWGGLPPTPVRVCLVTKPLSEGALISDLDRFTERQPGRLFFAEHEDRLIVLTPHDDTAPLLRILRRHHAAAGCSSPVDWPQLRVGLAEAGQAARRAGADRVLVEYEQVATEGMLGLLAAAGGATLARQLLLPLQSRPADERSLLLAAAAAWLKHNGAWDPAARELGVHRHTVRHRVEAVEHSLGLDLADFADRAELWAALQLIAD